MQIIITHGSLARTRVLRMNRLQLVAGALLLVALLMALSGAIYHYVFLKAAQAGDKPIVIRVETRAGHGQGTALPKQIEENADVLAFFERYTY